jgi:uncharacterized protein (TIGR02145 family)
MKNNLYYFILFPIVFVSCKTEEKTPIVVEKTPTVLVKDVSDVTYRTVTLNGEVTEEGFSAATDRGFVYSLSNANPSVSDTKVQSGYGKGAYSVTLDKLPINAKYYYRAFSTNSKGTSYSDIKSFNTISVVTVTSKTGRIWMDRNLGATQAATSLTDDKAYGDLYQWGRPTDGHQLRTSGTTTILSSTDIPGNSNFIISSTANPFYSSWNKQINTNLWQGVNGINNVCPTGFRLPSSKEWEQEFKTWIPMDTDGAFKSDLKLIGAGMRRENNGKIEAPNETITFPYWSSTANKAVTQNNEYVLSVEVLIFTGSITIPTVKAYIASLSSMRGMPVRCIKD